ncbi:MAG: hypothetical protein Roseis2KO_17000 [Roseivirga sp.]
MKKSGSLLFLLIILYSTANAQNSGQTGAQSLGFDLQIYPAGTIFNIKSAWAVSAKEELIGKLGYNIAQRQNFGEHDSEEGNGPGFTFAYKRYLRNGFKGWYAEGRVGMWFLDIDWRDNTPAASGSTDISVLQPTLGIGYDFALNKERLKLGLIVAFGYEVNIITSGEEVGQGGISLIGFSFTYNLNKAGKSSRAGSRGKAR